MTTSTSVNSGQSPSSSHDEIDLGKLFGTLLDNRFKIIAITCLFSLAGTSYALLSTPIYKADALIQVEEKSSGMPALGDMSEMFSSESSSAAEIELLKSRMILGKTADELNLTTVVTPKFMPVIGRGLNRLLDTQPVLDISRFILPSHYYGAPVFSLRVTNDRSGEYALYNDKGNIVLKGKVGELAEKDGLQLFVTHLSANADQAFTVAKRSRLDAIQWLSQHLAISERGKQTGMLQLSFTGEDRAEIQTILNNISQNYFLQNVARSSAEAEKSLEFLRKHIPEVQTQLIASEDKLNRYRQANDSVDLGLEAKATLDTMVQLEKQLNELTFKESEISQRFTKEHPAYISLMEKRGTLLGEKNKINGTIQKLPRTQREILRLTRDVEVNQQIYIQMLNNVQELNVLKASTVGNVRIIDEAESYATAVKPKKSLIVVLATLLGGMFGVAFSLVREAFNRGVENPDEIEALGLPVYASVPMSDWQDSFNKKKKKNANLTITDTLLSVGNPADLSIEALRSLRTSLHFAMMEAKNNIIMISGPSPSIGKSFVSANTAAVLAKGGQKVLLIDADMRKGQMEKQLSSTSKDGLSEFLSGKLAIDSLVKDIGVENFDFISRGSVPPNPAELLMHPRFSELMAWASQNYDLVIVDTPPLLAVTDAAIVGAHAGTSMLVGRFGLNSVKEIAVTKHRFEQNGVEIKGFILNAVVKKASNQYGQNYGYYNYSYDSKST